MYSDYAGSASAHACWGLHGIHGIACLHTALADITVQGCQQRWRLRREAFGHVMDRSMALVHYLAQSGPQAVHNIDNLMLRESMDVIGVPAHACTCLHLQLCLAWLLGGRSCDTVTCSATIRQKKSTSMLYATQ